MLKEDLLAMGSGSGQAMSGTSISELDPKIKEFFI